MSRVSAPWICVATCAVCALAIASCGVPKSSTIKRVDSPLGPSVTALPTTTTPTTSTSTTYTASVTISTTPTSPSTTTTPTTTPPTVPATAAPATTAPTTTAPVTTAVSTTVPVTQTPTTVFPVVDVELYFITGGQLTAMQWTLAKPAGPNQVIEALEQGVPPGNIGTGLRSAVPAGAIKNVTVTGGVANVQVVQDFRTLIPSLDQRLAIAQIVLSLQLPGIGQVTFSIDGVGIVVPRGDNTSSAPGALLTFDEYRPLVVG